MANFKIIAFDGPPCPRCGQPTQVREHKAIRARELRRPFYYSKWFYCANPRCATNTILPPAYCVFPEKPLTEMYLRLRAIKKQLGEDEDDHPIGAPDWGAFKRRR
jgi:hypothetical protein